MNTKQIMEIRVADKLRYELSLGIPNWIHEVPPFTHNALNEQLYAFMVTVAVGELT